MASKWSRGDFTFLEPDHGNNILKPVLLLVLPNKVSVESNNQANNTLVFWR